MAGATVELEQVGKRYGVGRPWVFKDVDLARLRRVVGHGESDQEISRLIDDGWHVVRVSGRPSGGIEIEAVRRDPAR